MTRARKNAALGLAVVLGLALMPAAAAARQLVAIKLDNFERGAWATSASEWHPVCMALSLGTNLLQTKPKSDVTMFLNLGAVYLADASESLDNKSCGPSGTVEAKWDAFLDAGGKVLVCPGCAGIAGLTPDELRAGATMGDMMKGDVPKLFRKAAKVIDY